MTPAKFFQQLDACIAKYDLLCHPFYKAWSAGGLTRTDLAEYAADYYPHVAAFPEHLGELAARTQDGGLRGAILANRADELGADGGPAHDQLWLDFAEGMGARPDEVKRRKPLPEVTHLIATFRRIASEGSPAEGLAAFYAYESQVPRVAEVKARGLREFYGADAHTCRYFTLHQTADVHHAQVWREQLRSQVSGVRSQEGALAAAEVAAKALWGALDGIERARQAGRTA
ncbi:MAG: iron-containing redox enzyme family protein [Acidobacteria bacterium]|nr:iron-containing redox enzyme family protein [Acidobacteriota bacterium]